MTELKFLFPIDGDFVNSRDGSWKDGALYVDVLLTSNDGAPTVCDIPSTYDKSAGCYKATVPLYGYRNCLVAKTQNHEQIITVLVTPEEKLNKFRVSSDDNIRFLKELTEGDYVSIFDSETIYFRIHC